MKKNKQGKKEKYPQVKDEKSLSKVKEAKKQLEAYLEKHKLNPEKDWTKDKKHGPVVKQLLNVINVNREKVKDTTPEEIHHKKSEDKKKPKLAKTEKISKVATKYDYPKVDGREMTPDEKRKYRTKMRKEAGGVKPKKVEKVETLEKKPSKEEVTKKKKKKVTTEEPAKKKKKKVKKND